MVQNGSSPAQEPSRPEHPKPTDDKPEKYNEMKPNEVPPANATVILVIGAAGAGKTSLIRLATGAQIPVGNGTQAGTVHCRTHMAAYQNTQFAFIDCPGFSGDDSDIVKIERIGRYICDLIRHGRSLHGILYLHDINVVRETPAMQRCLKFVEVITDIGGYRNVTFVTTKWDRLNPSGRIACGVTHNNLMNCEQWQIFRNRGARDSRHDGLDDLPNPSGAALQTAQTSLLNVLQFYLNNPGRMPLHLETQFRQSNQDPESTVQWLLRQFTEQEPTASTDSENNDKNQSWPFSPIKIAIAIGAIGAGAYINSQNGYFRARPTWNDNNGIGIKIYSDDNKKSKFYESWADDIYREQREQTTSLPEGRLSELFKAKPLDIGSSSFSGLSSSSRPFQFDTSGLAGFRSSDSSNFFQSGQRF